MISVIVLNWNGKIHLETCLNSLRQQTFPEFEVIVVDNGSSDGSVELIRTRFPEVRIVALPENRGFCAGNNLGIAAAYGQFIALLNNDTEVDPRWLQELYQGINSSPDIGLCASRILLFDHRTKIDSAGDGFAICGAAFKRGHHENAEKYLEPEAVFGACAAAAIYRKSMLEDIGLFDEDFFYIYEDADLSFRAQLAGYRCLYIPSAVVYHKGSTSLGKLSYNYVFYGQRNVEYVLVKNMPTRLLAKYLVYHWLYNVLACGYFVAKRRSLAFIKAKHAAMKNLPLMLEKRKEIQSRRRVSEDYLDSLLERRWLRTRILGK